MIGKEKYQMRVSVIIPVYNMPSVRICVDQLYCCLSDKDEIILVDDGSKDDTGSVCDSLAGKYSRVRVVHQKNQGAAAARNRGIAEASGRLIMFMDADDRILPGMIERAAEVFSGPQAPDLLLFGHSACYYRGLKLTRKEIRRIPADGVVTMQDIAKQLYNFFVCNALSPVWNKVFRKDILEETGLLLNSSMTVYEDLDFTLRYLAHCQSIYCMNRTGYCYRIQEKAGNTGKRMQRIEDIGEILEPLAADFELLQNVLIHNSPDVLPVYTAEKDRIIRQLFLILAREKLSVTGFLQLKEQCRKMRGTLSWLPPCSGNAMSKYERRMVDWIENNCCMEIYLERKYAALRHKAAVAIKSAGVRKHT